MSFSPSVPNTKIINKKLKDLLATPLNNSFYCKNAKMKTHLEFTYKPITKQKKPERSTFHHSLSPVSFLRTFSFDKKQKPSTPVVAPYRKSTSQYVSCSSAQKVNFSYENCLTPSRKEQQRPEYCLFNSPYTSKKYHKAPHTNTPWKSDDSLSTIGKNELNLITLPQTKSIHPIPKLMAE